MREQRSKMKDQQYFRSLILKHICAIHIRRRSCLNADVGPQMLMQWVWRGMCERDPQILILTSSQVLLLLVQGPRVFS